jgi:hypothetical protein
MSNPTAHKDHPRGDAIKEIQLGMQRIPTRIIVAIKCLSSRRSRRAPVSTRRL